MFPLFRKIRHKLLSEGRFTNYLLYAIGEIVLVVVGILIALGINNWNQDQKNRKREQMYLNSFKADLQECQTELLRVFDKTQRVKNSCQLLLDMGVDSIPMLPPKAFDSLVGTTFGYTIAMTNEGTLNDIRQSGDLSVIKNDTLRRFMASWDAGYKPIRERESLLKEAFQEHRMYMKTISDQSQNGILGSMFTPKARTQITKDTLYRNNLGNMALNASVLNRLYKKKIKQLDTLIDLTTSEIDN